MIAWNLQRTLVLVAFASVAASCSVVFGDYHVGQGTTSSGSGSGGGGGAGSCVVASDCPKPTSSCVVATCAMGVCSTAHVALGLAVPDGEQVKGDCKKLVCDGAGETMAQIDDTDLPVNSEFCTVGTCESGVIMQTPKPIDTDCAASGPAPKIVCGDPAGANGGKCVECNSGPQCASKICQDNACAPASCADGSKNGDETDLDCGGACPDCANGKTCLSPKDCISGFCPNGTCQQCVVSSQCPPDQFCGSGACTPDLPIAQPCTENAACASNFCTDGVCCNSNCNGPCLSCNQPGQEGTCTPIPVGQPDANYCNNPQVCDATGSCKTPDGKSCNFDGICLSGHCVDNVCCGTTCTGSCKTCNAPGLEGVCSFTPAGQKDPNGTPSCSGPGATCDGAGKCDKGPGSPCLAPAECSTGFCADGVCCNSACGGICQTCMGPGMPGSCSFVPLGQPDPNGAPMCTGPLACNGVGGCLKKPGANCSGPSECLSGVCQFNQCQ